MFKRRRLGSVYVKSPAQKIRGALGEMMAKIVFAIIACVGFGFLFQYVFIGIYNFLLVDFYGAEHPLPKSHPVFLSAMITGMAFLIIYILTRRMSKR